MGLYRSADTMHTIALRNLILLLALALPGACAKHDQAKAAKQPAAPKVNTIPWYKGTVRQAFDAAKAKNKPVFLYWGAVWCPPCEEVRNTVFKSERFIALSQLFIPVYIDGDSDRAQAIGERFGVKGYPTMIVFNAAGHEITRIPGGIDISRYNSVLQIALNRLKPTRLLLDIAMHNPSALQADDFTQLAYYSWDQDSNVLPKDAPDTLFRQLSRLARPHDKVAAARLFMQYLVFASRKSTRDKPVHIDHAYDRLVDILNADKLVRACWDTLAYYPEIAEQIVATDAQRQALEQLWQDQLMAMRHDPSIVTAEQLAGWLPLLHFHFATTSEPLSKSRHAALESDIVAADRSTKDPFARQAVVDQIAYVYMKARRTDEAKATLLAELDRSAAPWYFMSDLAALAEQGKNPDEAIKWYRQAYDESRGAATRFQWGAAYVRSLIRLKPDDDTLILSTASSLFNELKGPDDIFTGRNFRVLRRLDKALQGWQKPSTKASLNQAFTTRIHELCDKESAGSTAKRNCETLARGNAA